MKSEKAKKDEQIAAAAAAAAASTPAPAAGAQQQVRSNEWFHYYRYLVVVMCGTIMGLMLMLRVTITVAMVSMVNHTSLYIMEHSNSSQQDLENFFPLGYVETGEFDWTNEIQQTIFSGYMISYTLPQFFATRLTMRYGLSYGIPISLAACALSNILTPLLSYWGWQISLLLRLLNGLGASAILPSMINAIEIWIPPGDTAKGVVLFQFVVNIIYALSPLVAGFLTSIHWKWTFYVPGLVGLLFSFLWWLIVANTPEESKAVSQQELNYINKIDDQEQVASGEKGAQKASIKRGALRSDLPWHFMFRLKEFYSLTVTWSLQCATFGGFLFLLPTYMNRVLKIHVEEIGQVMFYVQIGTIFCMLWPHPLASFFQRRFNFSLSSARSTTVFLCQSLASATFVYLACFHDNLIVTLWINRFFQATIDNIMMATVMSMFARAGVSGLV